MSKKLVLAGKILTAWAAVLAIAILTALPASAHHKDGHEQGQGKKAASEEVTEDNDFDGQPNSYSGGESQHPSGKDRHIEPGGSGNQGKSPSHPDDSKGPQRFEEEQGADKPQSTTNGGGTNVYDQDGNNGCGNDQDFDDDNNGWCGRNPKKGGVSQTKPKDEVKANPPIVVTEPKLDVLPTLPTLPAPEDEVAGELLTQPALPSAAVQASSVEAPAARASVAGAVLPFTGAGITTFLLMGLGLVTLGGALLKLRWN